MKELSDKKRIALNLAAAICASFTTVCIGFFLLPFIVRTIGIEAQGFLQLASNFASWAALATAAINSMAGRFITIAIQQNDVEKAGKYYTSLFWGNLFIFAVFLLPILLFVLNLEKVINVPAHLLFDVKLLFALVFINFFLSNVFSVWSNTFYITNTPYWQSIGNAISTLIRAAAIFVLFSSLTAKVYYSALAALAVTAFNASWGLWHKNKLLPELKVKRFLFSLAHLRELFASGIWRSLQSTGEMLLYGLNLLVCNLLINPTMMGILALSKTIPLVLADLNWQIATTFAPQLTIRFAKGDKGSILSELRRACKINAIVGTIPLAGFLIFGKEFFTLWVPNQDAGLLQTLSVLACFGLLLVSGLQPIGNVFATVNKVRPLALSVIISGIINVAAIFAFLNFTDLGVYAIAGVSTVITIIRHIFYTIPAAARYLGFKWNAFFFGFGYSIIGSLAVSAIGFAVKLAIKPDDWLSLIACCAITGIIGLLANTFIIFSKDERERIWRR